jgi:hypothetical protein
MLLLLAHANHDRGVVTHYRKQELETFAQPHQEAIPAGVHKNFPGMAPKNATELVQSDKPNANCTEHRLCWKFWREYQLRKWLEHENTPKAIAPVTCLLQTLQPAANVWRTARSQVRKEGIKSRGCERSPEGGTLR